MVFNIPIKQITDNVFICSFTDSCNIGIIERECEALVIDAGSSYDNSALVINYLESIGRCGIHNANTQTGVVAKVMNFVLVR